MSRFGLRSCSDGLKHLEEHNNRRKVANPTSIASKRFVSIKESKFTEHINNNEDNLMDDIKIEADEIEKSFDTSDKLTKNKNTAGKIENDEEDDENNDNGNDNDNDDDEDYRQQSPVCKGTLVCSLPLERINEIIEKLNLNKSKVEKQPEEIMVDDTLDNDDDEEDDANISKQSASNIKNLCLYCDKKFSSHKMQLKHVDKFHCLQQDRRCSGRNAQLQQHQQTHIVPRKRKSIIEPQNFPGCNFCPKTKGQTQPVILPAAELSSLFLHLTECHTDKYFGCKMCVTRFQNITKLSKHMELVHKSLPFAFDETSCKSKDNDTDSLVSIDKLNIVDRSKLSLKRQQRAHNKSVNSCMNIIGSSVSMVSTTSQCSTAIVPNTSVIGAEEPILSRLGLTQNRLPNNRKGVRLRREKLLPELLLKSEQNHTSANFAFGPTTSISASASASSASTTCSPKLRGKSIKAIGGFTGDTTSDAVFRVPTRNDILSCVFDDNFYKEVVSNVRNNLFFHLDGKIMGNSVQELDASLIGHSHQPQIRSTLVKSPIVVTTMDSEIHAATSLAAITAFPTLLTAEQFGGDASTSKIRRPHTKNSWKWKWDSVKKFKLINEGGKIVKKMKHPMLGLRDLSKLDMWTQLTMRQKHELQQQQKANSSADDNHWYRATTLSEISVDPSREEKQRINDQLNFILDMRLLPHIILEQNEQAIIKLENDEFGIAPSQMATEDCGDNFMAQTFADENFLSMLSLLPNNKTQNTRTKLVLSGEWARPRCYLCVCCGAKFEKLKTLEEHKMFRHSQILSTHYEVVGRELLNGNLLRHLFIPKKALSRYGNESYNVIYSGAARRLFRQKNETLVREITNNDESLDSLQSVLHSCLTNSPSMKNSSSSSSTEDCDIMDSKISTAAAIQLIGNSSIVSPTPSIHSCSSSSSNGIKRHLKMSTSLRSTPIANTNVNSNSAYNYNSNNSNNSPGSGCSKCGRKCNGVLDLYRHMLDCSGDYIWSMAKKRKYRYYCGSKKRRPCNKHSILELRKSKNKTTAKSLSTSNDSTTEEAAVSSTTFTKIKQSPRSRPSDAESIKKMLENLPPKRICKKIFPTLSKTKKSIKNIKPKLLAKHKIYNSLRKTRKRQQMSQAAKILSKSKTKLKNSKKITTRSSTTSSIAASKVAKSCSNKNRNRIKMPLSKSNGSNLSDNPLPGENSVVPNSKVLNEFTDEVDCCSSIKTEKENTNEVVIKESVASHKPSGNVETKQISTNSGDLFLTNNTDSKRNFDGMSSGEKLLDTAIQPTKEVNPNVKCSTIANTVPIEVQTKENLNKSVAVETERHAPVNTKSVKRSKRISDCIAMLTGKLEEKLKTEQKTLAPNAAEKVTVTPQPLKSLTSVPIQPLLPLASLKPAEELTIAKSSPKKTPKRKAISRRIIKTDVSESTTNLPVLKASLETKIPLVNPNIKTSNHIEIEAALPNEILLPKPTAAPKIPTTPQRVVTSAGAKKFPDLAFAQIETNRPVNFNPTAIVSSMPPPGALSNASALMPKIPLFIPMDNVRHPTAAPHVTPMALPMPLPVPVPVPMPNENVAQTSPAAISAATVAAVGTNMIPTPVIPLITAVPAHLAAPPPPIQLTVTPFNIANANVAGEPLNLSNSSKNVQKQTQDLSCAGLQRMSGMPARRQTICGFEVRNFAVFDEMEPLDLSKKPRPDKNAAVASSFPTRHMEMATLLLPPPQPLLALPNDSTVLTIQPLTSEVLLNKPFYSNLDLLRIPQVRNPVAGQVSLPINEPAVQPAANVVVTPTPPAIIQPPNKTTNKKRNKPSALHTTINANVATVASNGEGLVMNTTLSSAKLNNAKDATNTPSSSSKKEATAKNKSILRMDEVVINHIDDAINSVINAVKASLDNEEALKAQEMVANKCQTPAQTSIQIKTTDDVSAGKETVGEFKYLTAARRSMRSKTLDCRPAALNKTGAKSQAASVNQTQNVTALLSVAAVPNDTTTFSSSPKSITNQHNELLKCLDNKTQTGNKCPNQVTISERIFKDQKEAKIEAKKTDLQTAAYGESLESKLLVKPGHEHFPTKRHKTQISEETICEKPLTTAITRENSSKEPATHKTKSSVDVAVEMMPAKPVLTELEETKTKNILINSIATNTSNLDLEHMSNNNNTSSGFHSSVQSDQQTSVMSTTTSAVSVPSVATEGDTKKKQRRRRKNELAAIVADQLLESFKLDKARRDNLKKLENLAYEKSEDLLLTGMLLMSSTKRNVATAAASSSSSNNNGQAENIEHSSAGIKRAGKTSKNNQVNDIEKQINVYHIENKITTTTAAAAVAGVAAVAAETESAIEKPLENDKDPLEIAEPSDGKKNNKRRQYRRRGKNLDNENISKLKSSLESFSIDIERQLNEYEAKNSNVFKNVTSNDNAKQTGSSKNQTPTNVNKTSIILRPSILSVTLDNSVTPEVPPQTPTKTLTNDSNKTVVSSRDPRLNKNIHKEDEKHNEEPVFITATKQAALVQKNNAGPEEIGDLDEDNYLTEIAKNVNEKIMSTENEEFAFKNDGFELVNDMGMDDSNSKFSRPPTSMSVRSAPSFNDDRSNFGSICDENTNTEVMDMDLDDEMSVYTSYSQDLGRGRGRRRRRRRSILLTRKPKKRATSRDMSAEKIECILCKKVFYSANSLSKHNMTLAHVSKVSEQEYLLSKSQPHMLNATNSEQLQTFGSLGPYARRSTRRSTISEPPLQSRSVMTPTPPLLLAQPTAEQAFASIQSSQALATFKTTIPATPETLPQHGLTEGLKPHEPSNESKTSKSLQKPFTKEQASEHEYEANINATPAYNGNSRLNLNPDERLFFECCNILKSAETPRLNNVVSSTQECNVNGNGNFSYAYNNNHDKSAPITNMNVNRPPVNNLNIEVSAHTNHNQVNPSHLTTNSSNLNAMNQQSPPMEPQNLFRDPQLINHSSCYNKVPLHSNRNTRSPIYSAVSHLSAAVTNTTSRFKTKAAMKGYENVNMDLNQQQESKSRTICKLTELAEIALGNEEKPNSNDFSPIQSSLMPPTHVPTHHIIHPHQNPTPKLNVENVIHPKGLDTPEYVTTLVSENIRECNNVQLPTRSERTKNNETRSSTSSKTIMHSSIIKAAVEEHQRTQATSNKIIIPDRPFKNIGLEEKETITFQKPKAPSVNLLTEDNNSVSTGSFSDRDDYDFGSLSCDDEASIRESNDKNQKNNTTESSSESSRATAKTFENKSLIMGRIFKNASTKAAIKHTAVNTVKVKSVGVQKDQISVPKADMNQLFDELRGNSGVDDVVNDRTAHPATVVEAGPPVVGIPVGENGRGNHKQYSQQREVLKPFAPAASPPAVVSSTTATLPTNARKAKARVSRAKSNAEAKTRKDISKLQTELGMSPDEIKKLIDEGQRKSKRRCATNRPKKLVEMWSSDEYEEFLSTKDIIALIEEKEQLEKRKKRKNSLNNSTNAQEVAKEREIVTDVTSSTKDLKRRNTPRISGTAERSPNILDASVISPPKTTKTKKAANKKEEPVSTTANIRNVSELAVKQKFKKSPPQKGRRKKTKAAEVIENSSTITASDNNNVSRRKCSNNKTNANKSKNKATPQTKQVPAANESSRAKYQKLQYGEEEESNENVSDDDDDEEDDFLISELKSTKQNKTRSGRLKMRKSVAAVSAAIVTSTANHKSTKLAGLTRETSTKKRGSNNNNTSCGNANIAAGTSTSTIKLKNNQTPTKTKRKNVSNQSPPRRKRLATEKLYYWSSSSDEDFGRINKGKGHLPPPDNYESGIEQYQKHGWIVGDSHKKLVTLLAIAKGNKKIDSNSGVKKNIAKKRN